MNIFLSDLRDKRSGTVNVETRVHSGKQELQHLTNEAEVAFRR